MSDLEEQVERLARAAPMRRAPFSLEQRVLSEIRRREALPWWQRSFSRWPRPAQAALAVTCCLIIAVLLSLKLPWSLGEPATMTQLFPLMATRLLPATLTRLVPADWVYGALTGAAFLYAALFGLGAAAYRTLYLQPTSDDIGP